MTFIEFGGSTTYLDDVLEQCLASGVFQPDYASKFSEYSIGTSTLLRNPYGGLMIKIGEVAQQLKIDLLYQDFSTLPFGAEGREAFVEQAHEYLNILRQEYPQYFDRKNKLNDDIFSYQAALDMLSHVSSIALNFDDLFSGSFLKVRFGKLPTASLKKLDLYADKPFVLHELSVDQNMTWCLYVTAEQFHDEIDELMMDVGFTRLRIPDYVHGNTEDAVTFIRNGLEKEMEALSQTGIQIDEFVKRERNSFLMLYSKSKFYHDSYDLRRYVVSIRNQFHLIGFIMTKDEKEFLKRFEDFQTTDELVVKARPATENERVKTPVRLKNNWFTKPFEMFVTMYGTPSYNDIDPTPFVAYTYSLLFGMMFGDLGQGLCIVLIGLFLAKKKKMQLGGIMSRIGVASMLFGTIYGSVFGYEHVLNPFFKLLGFHEKPIEVMRPETTNTILIAAVALGAAIILMVIVFNIIIGIKHKNFERIFLSQNGVAGFVFYAAVLVAAVSFIEKKNILTTPYIVGFFVLPLLLMFLREPITRFAKAHSTDTMLHTDQTLLDAASFKTLDNTDIRELFTTQFISARFGRIPTDSYQKMSFYMNEPFMLYPLKTDEQYIWCIYAMATTDKQQMDAIFTDLFFERIHIPAKDLATNEQTESFIKGCIDSGQIPQAIGDAMDAANNPITVKKKTMMQRVFPEGFGGFFVESFFEMFEVLLSFITNTMSFLRVGGFILSHAGMMSVVMTLSHMAGAGANIIVIIVGNLFVMALEGLIVGIQALRLEFYEMFSRYFDANGEGFFPIVMNYTPKTN